MRLLHLCRKGQWHTMSHHHDYMSSATASHGCGLNPWLLSPAGRLTDTTWIGLNDRRREGVFRWDSDKSLVSFKKYVLVCLMLAYSTRRMCFFVLLLASPTSMMSLLVLLLSSPTRSTTLLVLILKYKVSFIASQSKSPTRGTCLLVLLLTFSV